MTAKKKHKRELKSRVNVHAIYIRKKLPLKSGTGQLKGYAASDPNSVVKSLQAEYYTDPSVEYIYILSRIR